MYTVGGLHVDLIEHFLSGSSLLICTNNISHVLSVSRLNPSSPAGRQ